MNADNSLTLLHRRGVLSLLGAGLLRPSQALAASCTATPAETEGPYFVEENLNRSDIRVDPSDGSIQPGIPLTLQITVSQVTSSGCGVLPGVRVEIWHCNAGGVYSDEAANNSSGRKFLRGYQITDENGVVNFTTIYPGWYTGRAVHIHFKVRTYSGSTKLDEFTSQFYFDESVTDVVHAQSPYSQHGQRDTRNSTDGIFRGTSNSDRLLLNVTKTDQGYAATADVGVNLKTPVVSSAVITSNGVVNAASYQPGVSPGAWITIFGQNFSNSTRSASTSDLVNGNLPTALGGISVKINNRDAFIQFVSATQINVQAPSDANTGTVQVTVTNSAGTSAPVTATLQAVLPAFFTSQNYVLAVRSDNTVVTAQAVRPGDSLSLYGTGFGQTNPPIAPGAIVQTAAPLAESVTITVGGMEAPVSFAGLSAAGLDQFNITVPNAPAGDQEVIATISGVRSRSGALLKIAG
jgi:uncharacterized protein (TIGR03437 family)